MNTNSYHRIYYQKNKDIIRKKAKENYDKDIVRGYIKKYYNKRKKKILDIYGNICSCCGESNVLFLTFDHTNNDGYIERKEINQYKIINNAIKNPDKNKYSILCYNCNMGKRDNGGICPHKINNRVIL